MKTIVSLLVILSLLLVTASCARQLVYEGPTPTDEVKIVKEKSCN